VLLVQRVVLRDAFGEDRADHGAQRSLAVRCVDETFDSVGDLLWIGWLVDCGWGYGARVRRDGFVGSGMARSAAGLACRWRVGKEPPDDGDIDAKGAT
jgi:hypothetical protein